MRPKIYDGDRATSSFGISERRRLLGSILNHYPIEQTLDLASSYGSFLSPLVPERNEGELAMDLKLFFNLTHKHPLDGLLKLVAFLVSNNMLNDEQIFNFLKFVNDQKCLFHLPFFLRIETATTRIFPH